MFTVPLLAGLDPVHTASGPVAGIAGTDPSVRVYKGIPYAAAPVGDLRWKPPQPLAAAWKEVRETSKFSNACEQPPYPKASIYHRDPEPTSEDCLYLNIWTAAQSARERRPVMVWIHGGALTRGSGSINVYDGEALAKKGVVVVTLNYRLGIFGFFAHPELSRESPHHASGNYGLLDQLAALQWVKKNIAAFGGDPARVTIFGESAGAWSVNYLTATPLGHGLFERAIAESGAAFAPQATLAEAEAAGQKFSKTASLSDLRARPAHELLQSSSFYSFPPCVDGWLLPQQVDSIYKSGKENNVPLLIGSNADEGTALAPWSSTAAAFLAEQKKRFGKMADEFFRLYPASTEAQAEASHYASFRDFVFGWGMRAWARASKAPAYLYYFSHVPPGPVAAKIGAYHASEIAYVFDNLDKIPALPWRDSDRKLAETLSTYWVNFARTGNPNSQGAPEWPVYRESTDKALLIGDKIEHGPVPHKQALDFLNRYFTGLRSAHL